MNRVIESLPMDNEMFLLKEKLDDIVGEYEIDSDAVLELSRELDTLIVKYYNDKK